MQYSPAPNIEITLPGLVLATVLASDDRIDMTTADGRS